MENNRYNKKHIHNIDDDIYTVDDFIQLVKSGMFCDDDGSGYWIKDGFVSNDEVFSSPKLDATHVIWYNK